MISVSLIRLWAIIFLCWGWERTDKDLALNKWNRKLGTASSALHMESYRQLSTFNISYGKSSVYSRLITLKEKDNKTNKKEAELFHLPVFEPRPYLLISFGIQQRHLPLDTTISQNDILKVNWKNEVGKKLRMTTMKYVSLFCVSGNKGIYFGSDSTHNHLSVTSLSSVFTAGNLRLM